VRCECGGRALAGTQGEEQFIMRKLAVALLLLPLVSFAEESWDRRAREFVSRLPLEIVCIPHVSGGVFMEKGKETYSSGSLQIPEEDKFVAKIGLLRHFESRAQRDCEVSAGTMGLYEELREPSLKDGQILCMSLRFMTKKSDVFSFACKIDALEEPLYLRCRNLLLEPEGTFLQVNWETFFFAYQASVTTGTCSSIPK
jgi:hypothetical protein